MNRDQVSALLQRADIVLAQAVEARAIWQALQQTPVTVADHPRIGEAHVLIPGVVHWHEPYLQAEMARHTYAEDTLLRFGEAAEQISVLRSQAEQANAGFFRRVLGLANIEVGLAAARQLEVLLNAPQVSAIQPLLLAARQARKFTEIHTIGHPEEYTTFAAKSLALALGLDSIRQEYLDPAQVARLHALVKDLLEHPDSEPRLRAEAERALQDVTDMRVEELMAQLPVETLKQATQGQLRFSGLETIQVTTVADVLRVPLSTLTSVNGIGEQTARRMKGAAQTLRYEAKLEHSTRIGDVPTAPVIRLVRVLARFSQMVELDAAERARKKRIIEYAQSLPSAMPGQDPWLVCMPSHDQSFETFVDDLAWALASPALFQPHSITDLGDAAWEDYQQRPAHYQGLLQALLGLEIDVDNELLDASIIDQIRRLRLDTSLLQDLFLRGYQSYGARFALVQKKTILGDEMGLGKTVQALAMLAHLHAQGVQHSVIVCPAALVVNWVREIRKFSTIAVYAAHGALKQEAMGSWVSDGGILLCTYDGARTLEFAVTPQAIVADEAHFLKNPATRRSQAVSKLISQAEYALLLTGTPLENRVAEFLTLVGYLQPELVPQTQKSALSVRRSIAPAYLRRNQSDVLSELPERLDQIDWVELNTHDQQHYKNAVASGNWMEIRRAPMFTPDMEPAKLERIRAIVETAGENGDRIIIFSYFLPVLERIEAALGERVVGVITGKVSPTVRQEYVDNLGRSDAGSCLLAQITAAGVGLNIQAATVVILVEPQVKPTIEDQAIARAHRMGQTRVVQVHRLIADDTADERLLNILAEKRAIFDSYARPSESAQVEDAVDISEAQLAAQIIAEERARLNMDAEPTSE
ncbi:DEAD/DEAH box helicase [Corynebacterium freiburgense]|uniref:DEAD/DEAH box helicase n=1 Tax=Corynebacterium freiburgense TaxID=556548 RepID=UPI000421B239|nr:DEAD/DEAH box helicase [Corynebacterium freiburgense]WJZ02809.1 ATP-dependent helicase HepA [Corynebacterium freiburgense]